ncbi:hypothetical protein C7B62_24870 [Pleurocapsa sp. CCALA 161]|uniref:hypothetical protein n=1 Tax=Pleurocapsa sp. CCALA 161 TaxID=2107688 RepID=UPI000D055577|nr:hypothetical protein [Pleurocapsa sp. CCALA 161]PSB05592.1 hypothetical protein C7B62_24870 [Pleurocapsa sp. CCALA 161]
MLNWNIVVDVQEHSFSRAYLLLEEFGTVFQSDFENILLMNVNSIPEFLDSLNSKLLQDPSLKKVFARIVPVTSTFSFQSAAEFETKAKDVLMEWLSILAGKRIYVRMHRKGLKDRLDGNEEENHLDLIILQELEKLGKPGQISLKDPEAIVFVETISQQAGLSCWTCQDLENYPWLKLNLSEP